MIHDARDALIMRIEKFLTLKSLATKTLVRPDSCIPNYASSSSKELNGGVWGQSFTTLKLSESNP